MQNMTPASRPGTGNVPSIAMMPTYSGRTWTRRRWSTSCCGSESSLVKRRAGQSLQRRRPARRNVRPRLLSASRSSDQRGELQQVLAEYDWLAGLSIRATWTGLGLDAERFRLAELSPAQKTRPLNHQRPEGPPISGPSVAAPTQIAATTTEIVASPIAWPLRSVLMRWDPKRPIVDNERRSTKRIHPRNTSPIKINVQSAN